MRFSVLNRLIDERESFQIQTTFEQKLYYSYTVKTISPQAEITWGALRAVEVDPSWRNIAQVGNARGGRVEQEQNLHKVDEVNTTSSFDEVNTTSSLKKEINC